MLHIVSHHSINYFVFKTMRRNRLRITHAVIAFTIEATPFKSRKISTVNILKSLLKHLNYSRTFNATGGKFERNWTKTTIDSMSNLFASAMCNTKEDYSGVPMLEGTKSHSISYHIVSFRTNGYYRKVKHKPTQILCWSEVKLAQETIEGLGNPRANRCLRLFCVTPPVSSKL